MLLSQQHTMYQAITFYSILGKVITFSLQAKIMLPFVT